jgi:hypothetical protein
VAGAERFGTGLCLAVSSSGAYPACMSEATPILSAIEQDLPCPQKTERLLAISPRKADQVWAYARAWLREELDD